MASINSSGSSRWASDRHTRSASNSDGPASSPEVLQEVDASEEYELRRVCVKIIKNSEQQKQGTLVLDSSISTFAKMIEVIKNRLRMKKVKRIFLIRSDLKAGFELVMPEMTAEVDFLRFRQYLAENQRSSSLLCSFGEDYVGKECIERSWLFDQNSNTEVHLIASQTPVEDEAVRQLKLTSLLDGMRLCVGMPDLHVGRQFPIGAAFLTEDIVYPQLIGGDIGCGMTLFALTGVKKQNVIGKERNIASKLDGLEGPWPGDSQSFLKQEGVTSDLALSFADSLGTVGRGNHFAELQVIGEIYDIETWRALGVDANQAFLLVHSGSRGFGSAVLNQHISNNGPNAGLRCGTAAAQTYLQLHDEALRWARCNRSLIAQRIFEALDISDSSHRKLVDLHHNHVCYKEIEGKQYLLHRKGAAPSDGGLVVIPGSRGTLTYLVAPVGNQSKNAYSVAHGAGREMSRSSARSKLQAKHTKSRLVEELSTNHYGGVVVCDDRDLLCEEAPIAYKEVEAVVSDLEQAGILKIVACLIPKVTYKFKGGQDL